MLQIRGLGLTPIQMTDLPLAGRLVHFFQNWSVITQDRWVLNTVRGYLIDLCRSHTNNPSLLPTSLLSSESADSRGTIQPHPKTSNQTAGVPLRDRLLLQHFPGSQKEWGTEAGDQPQSSEPVCSPRTFQNGGHTHLEGPDETRGLAGKDRPQGCLSGDLDRPDTQGLSQVSICRQDYHFTCLPFGLSSAPGVFTKTLKPALALLHARGVRLIAYIDDILVLAESKELLLDHLEGMSYLLECLGFIINAEKSVMIPSHIIELLGLTVNSTIIELSLPPLKIKQIRAEA